MSFSQFFQGVRGESKEKLFIISKMSLQSMSYIHLDWILGVIISLKIKAIINFILNLLVVQEIQ